MILFREALWGLNVNQVVEYTIRAPFRQRVGCIPCVRIWLGRLHCSIRSIGQPHQPTS